MDEIAAWDQAILTDRYPAGPDREAKDLILTYRNRVAKIAAQDAAPSAGVAAAVQWNRTVLILADAERASGRSGWRSEWTDVYDYFVDGNDEILGPFGPAGP
ncbi:hypothetical protein AB0H17_15745 [Streptomyces olivoreticuli]